jgi:hypothetical protein
MKVSELIAELQKMPQEVEVERLDWVCGGETHYDWLSTAMINRVLPLGNEHDPKVVVIA